MSIARNSAVAFRTKLLHEHCLIARPLRACTLSSKTQSLRVPSLLNLQRNLSILPNVTDNMLSNQAAWITEAKANPLTVKAAPYVDPEANEVVVKNAVIGITPVDNKVQDMDLFKMKYPIVLGNETAGEVVAVGDSVNIVKVGQRIMG